ncbi:hypothetical protein GM418_05140 [Maribellus comscasis]|uniref:Uncharacterized protein n=1 Tax=Maribellus comscasis TaxID=2681766 RepID=A0A6I6JJL9_9BACT|nr:hypothetical protein [Maribellus comscasis]QGY43065.1 hypothetical protein GM418_05140 [Maribellus comscasis]
MNKIVVIEIVMGIMEVLEDIFERLILGEEDGAFVYVSVESGLSGFHGPFRK